MRNKIINAASKLFTEKGVEKTSLAEIASHVQISKGTLYYHFSTKNDLIFAVVDMHMEGLTDNLLKLLGSSSSPDKIIAALFETVPKALTRNRLHVYLLREAVTKSPQLFKRFQFTYKYWKRNLIENLEKYYPDFKDIEAFAAFLVASIDGLIIQNLLEIDNVEPERYSAIIQSLLKPTT